MTAATVGETFARLYGTAAIGVWAGPGRVNLIGEHTDYNDGFVLPFALGLRAHVAVRPRSDGLVRCASVQSDLRVVEHALDDLRPRTTTGWSSYILGVAWSLREHGLAVPGFDLLVDSDIPQGAGLSSSAGLETSTGLALSALAGEQLAPMELALVCHRAETEFVGAPVGIMDQVVSACAQEGSALLLDCRSRETTHVGFDPARLDTTLLVIDTGVKHDNTGPAYAERRGGCEKAAAELGMATLRDATLGDDLGPRARHVVTENQRVLDAVEALRRDDIHGLGELLVQSHASLRDDFEVSCLELDLAVETAMSAGAHGARLTGAGFGGCAIALVPQDRVDAVTDDIATAFGRADLPAPTVFAVSASPGARREA